MQCDICHNMHMVHIVFFMQTMHIMQMLTILDFDSSGYLLAIMGIPATSHVAFCSLPRYSHPYESFPLVVR